MLKGLGLPWPISWLSKTRAAISDFKAATSWRQAGDKFATWELTKSWQRVDHKLATKLQQVGTVGSESAILCGHVG